MSNNIKHIDSISPEITWNRFDLTFKFAYLQELEHGIANGFGKECYSKHIDAFSLGSYTEPGDPEKNSLQKYLDVFGKLNQDIKEKGFDISKGKVPLARDGSILNGAHRTTIGLYHHINLPVEITNLAPQEFDYKYFKARGLNEEYLDFGALKYIENSQNLYMAIIWPRANADSSAIERFFPKLIYSKKVKLNYNGAHNLLAEAYKGEHWLGEREENYPGVKNKLIECFPNFKPIEVYLFHEDDLEEVLLIKDRVRDKLGSGKHSIHITDNDEETKLLAKLLFNFNSLHYLNNAKPNAFLNQALDEFISKHSSAEALFVPVLGPVTTLSLYGLQKTNDIDVVTDFDNKAVKKYAELDMNSFKSTTFCSPRDYFYHSGVKCLSLNEVMNNYSQVSNMSPLKQRYMKLKTILGFSVQNKLNAITCKIGYWKLKYKILFREKLGLFLRYLGVSQLLKKAIRLFRGCK